MLDVLAEDGLQEVVVGDEVEDLVAPLLGLVREVGPYEVEDGLPATLQGELEVGLVEAELQLVEGDDAHGQGSEGTSHLGDVGRVGWAQLLVTVQESHLRAY